MNRHLPLILMALLLTVAGCSSSKPKSEDILFWDLPAPVQKYMGDYFAGARISTISRLTWKDGVTWYRIDFTYSGGDRSILMTPEGTPAPKN